MFLAVACDCGGTPTTPAGYPEVREGREYPMLVWVDPDLPAEVHLATRMAMAEFPCSMFLTAPTPIHADVTISLNEGQSHCHGATGLHFDEKSNAGEYMRCSKGPSTIILTNRVTADPKKYNLMRLFILVQHELGHAAGLDHAEDSPDDNPLPMSVMEPKVLKHEFKFRDGVPSPSLTKPELHTLVEGYCR